ncbi:zinc finger protein 40 [Eucyclogobius newberryi]|uniref:zinc finger protein 40 n=1 Tax=Eucyclogobius newberryi TaxID=166745 RepID=UPI003B5B886A
MPRTKQNHPKNLKDKIEEAQKELKDPEGAQKGVSESSSRNVDKSQSLKRKKVVAGNQLKKIPKSPVKKPLQSKPSVSPVQETPPDKPTPPCASSSSSNSPVHLHPAPSSGQADVENANTAKSPKGAVPEQERIVKEPKSAPAEPLQVEKTSLDTSPPPPPSEISKTQSPKQEEEPYHSSAPLDVLLKAMEPDFSTLAERKNQPIGKVSTQASIGEVQAMPALNVGIQSSHTQTYYIDEQGNFIGISAPIQGAVQAGTQTLQSATHFLPVANQEKPRLQMSFNPGPVAMTHGTNALPQSQPPIVQTCQSLSASVPSSIQVPVTPGSNQVQMATVMNFGDQISKDQKPKKPGKYVCEYCNRACAKPSVLLKHIRSHTGERPYPCVTCGFSFKTKSNLYKHKKSHAHAIKLGLMARSELGSGSLSQESEKGAGTHSETEDTGESDEDGSSHELEQELSHVVAVSESGLQSLNQACHGEANQSNVVDSCKVQQKSHEPKVTAALPKVVVYPVNVSPLRADSPRVTMAAPEQAAARQREFQAASLRSSVTVLSSLREVDGTNASLDVSEDEDQQCKSPLLGGHAQLQRQQATDFSQQQQPKCLLSPRSLGSTDSGYFSRSESADQAMSPPSPFVKITPPVEMDKNPLPSMPPVVATVMHVQSEPETRPIEGQMRPPLEPKALSLEERILKLISDNEAVVDNKQLDSVKPRRTSLSRRGSIDSPKSYIFKDSFQFDLKPIGRRSSSSSDIPKSPFTPTDKSKPVFLLSVPSQYSPMDCLPITRSNSMPTTPGHSALPVNVPPLPHPLRICQSFDEKIGTLNDDVFSSAPPTPNPAMHARTLVRQVAVEDFSTSHEGHGLPTVRSMDEGYQGPPSNMTELMQRSRSFEHNQDKTRKPLQSKGTMYECETCRNRYRKLENFETHKKFYCSELHGPKNKPVKDVETEVFHVHMQQPPGPGSIDQQTSFRKRRMKMKSVGDEDDQSPTDTVPPCSVSFDSGQLATANRTYPPHAVIVDVQPKNSQTKLPQIQLVARGTSDARLSPIRETKMANKGELQRQGSETSVIRHTNSLSRPNSMERESMDRASPVENLEKDLANKPKVDQVANISKECYHESKSNCVDFGKQRVTQYGEGKVVEIPTTPVHQSRLVRQNNIQVPEILVTEEPDRETDSQNVDSSDKPVDQFNWPQRSESLSKLPAEKLPPKKKRIRLAQMDHSSGESSFESSLSRSQSRDSSLSRGSSISASFDREESLRSESPSRADYVNKNTDLQGLPAAFNTLNVPGVMRRAASEQITCTQPSVEVSTEYRSKSFDCGNVLPSRSPSPVGLPKTGHVSQVPLIERRRGPLVRQMSLKIGPESQQPVWKSVTPLEKVANVYSLTQSKPPHMNIANRNTVHQPFVLQTGEQPLQKNEQLVQCINLGSPTLQPQIHGLPHPWHQTSRVQICQKTQLPLSQILVCRDNLQNKPTEKDDKIDFVPKYQLPCSTLRSSQTFTFSNAPGTQIALPVFTIPIVGSTLGISKSSEVMRNVAQHASQPTSETQPQASAIPLPQILITHEQIHPAPTVSHKNMVMPTPPTEMSAKKENRSIQPVSSVELASSIGPMQCTQKLASVSLCPQQEPTASSKRMLSPANSLDIYMEKHQKRAKDEHGVACLTDGRSINYLNSKMSEVTRQRKLMLVRQTCTTEPADSPIETEAPPLSPPKSETVKDGEASEDDVKPMSPDGAGTERETCTIIPEETCTLNTTSQSLPVLKTQDKIEEQKWLPAKSPIRPSSFNSGQVKLTTSVSVVNTRDSHRLSFPSLKTTTTYTWCFLMKRKCLHAQQTDLKTSAYSAWAVSPINPNPLGLPTKVAMSLFDSKQSSKKILYTSAIKTSGVKDLLSYSGKLKDVMPKVPLPPKSKSSGARPKPQPELQSSLESDKEPSKNEPRRVKIFDGGYKSNEDYVYVRGRGRGKYICEECGIRCKKPSMLRKHIRTHSDLRPYHCNHCNFSFKTKGNLTKHMKSKAHSKKCLEMGLPEGLHDDQDADDSGDRSHVGSADRPDSDADDSDDENEDEDEEEDSQAESGLSTNPSVSASPQHFPCKESDVPPSALLAQMSISSVLPLCPAPSDTDSFAMLSPKEPTASGGVSVAPGPSGVQESPSAAAAAPPAGVTEASDTESVHMMSPVSPCRQMSIDFPDFEGPPSPPAPGNKAARSGQAPSPALTSELSLPVDRGTQTSIFPTHTPLLFPQNPAATLPLSHPPAAEQTHLFSHLPLHSQQPPRPSYNMLPVGGIQLVPAGLAAYSAFVPIQAGQVQLTIPAVGVIHRAASPAPAPHMSPQAGERVQNRHVLLQDPSGGVPGFAVAQTLQPLNLEALNILGIANAGLASTQLLQQQGLTLGLQVLAAAASPTSQSSAGLQIVNIALPAIIPSMSPILSPLPESQAERGQSPAKMPMSPVPVAAGGPPTWSAGPAIASGDANKSTNVDKREVSDASTEQKTLESQTTKASKMWQISRDDFSEASSDDEDRLVIAT